MLISEKSRCKCWHHKCVILKADPHCGDEQEFFMEQETKDPSSLQCLLINLESTWTWKVADWSSPEWFWVSSQQKEDCTGDARRRRCCGVRVWNQWWLYSTKFNCYTHLISLVGIGKPFFFSLVLAKTPSSVSHLCITVTTAWLQYYVIFIDQGMQECLCFCCCFLYMCVCVSPAYHFNFSMFAFCFWYLPMSIFCLYIL